MKDEEKKEKKKKELKWIYFILLAISFPLISVMLIGILSYFFNFLVITEELFWLISSFLVIFLIYIIFKIPKDQEVYINSILYLTLFAAPLLFGIFYTFGQMVISASSSPDFFWWYSIINLLVISMLLGILISLIRTHIKSKKLIDSELLYVVILMLISVGVFIAISAVLSLFKPFMSCPLSR